MQPLDHLPLLAFFIVVVFCSLLAIEGGYVFGKRHRTSRANSNEAPTGAAISSTLGLLAFMLAFTFGIAAARFDERRALIVEEANAIGTANLRADLIEEPHKTNVKSLLRQCLTVEIDGFSQPQMLAQTLAQSNKLHDKLWSQTAAVGNSNPHSPVFALFIASINDVIDLQTKRLAATQHARVPESVWGSLFLVAILSMAGMGYYFGVTNDRSWIANIILVVTFSTIMLLVVDLDRPWEGSLKVSEAALDNLREQLGD